eukprot:7389465-Prymnesium_polylepis.1
MATGEDHKALDFRDQPAHKLREDINRMRAQCLALKRGGDIHGAKKLRKQMKRKEAELTSLTDGVPALMVHKEGDLDTPEAIKEKTAEIKKEAKALKKAGEVSAAKLKLKDWKQLEEMLKAKQADAAAKAEKAVEKVARTLGTVVGRVPGGLDGDMNAIHVTFTFSVDPKKTNKSPLGEMPAELDPQMRLRIGHIQMQSAAYKCGARPGDIIVAVDGVKHGDDVKSRMKMGNTPLTKLCRKNKTEYELKVARHSREFIMKMMDNYAQIKEDVRRHGRAGLQLTEEGGSGQAAAHQEAAWRGWLKGGIHEDDD